MTGRNDSIVPLVEPIPIREVFATGLAPVENCGEYVRLVFFSDHIAPDGHEAFGNHERMIVARLVLPTGVYRDCVRAMLDAPALVSQ